MIIYNDIQYFKRPVAVTVGSFDGLHRGHRAMIEEASRYAGERGLPLLVISFDVHPKMLFSQGAEPFLLSSNEQRMTLFETAGVEQLMLLPFTRELASLSAQQFIAMLAEKINAKMLAVGYDNRFGAPCPGEGFVQYVEYGKEVGVEVVQLSRYAPGEEKISSSQVRAALRSGDVQQAENLLGRRYSIVGRVVHGAALGRRLGFPTANMQLQEPMQMLPLDGVYECEVSVHGKYYKGVMNVGHKPTVAGEQRTIEVYIIDFVGDIYGETVTAAFVRRLRGERHFASLDDLRRQIESDVKKVIIR